MPLLVEEGGTCPVPLGPTTKNAEVLKADWQPQSYTTQATSPLFLRRGKQLFTQQQN